MINDWQVCWSDMAVEKSAVELPLCYDKQRGKL